MERTPFLDASLRTPRHPTDRVKQVDEDAPLVKAKKRQEERINHCYSDEETRRMLVRQYSQPHRRR